MSRTDKDRPYWVKLNDPNSPRYPYHQHYKIEREKYDEEPIYRLDFYGREYLAYTVGLYRKWSEGVECTLDRPEETPSTWRFRNGRSYRVDKNGFVRYCGYQLHYDGDYESSKGWKRAANRAVRHDINRQLRQARYDVELDIYNDSKYNSSNWWD